MYFSSLISLLVTVILLFFTIGDVANAGAWVVDAGKYKYFGTHMLIDKRSQKQKKQRQQDKYEYQLQEHDLNELKDKIIALHKANNGDGVELKESDKVLLKTIDQDIEEINLKKGQLSRPIDHSLSKFAVEYGVKDKNSVGAVIYYDVGRFDYKYNYGNSAEFYFKHELWKQSDYVLTLVPHFAAINYNKEYNKTLVGSGLFLGKSSSNKGYDRYRELGITVAKAINKTPYKEKKISMSMQEGYTIPAGITFSSYVEFEYTRIGNKYNEVSFFEQIMVAKTFNIDSFSCDNLTLQAGYFWKASITGDFNTISGPVFSFYFSI